MAGYDLEVDWSNGVAPGLPRDTTIAAMDAADVDVAMLSAWCGPSGWLITNDEVTENIARFPARFKGLTSVDLNNPMAGGARNTAMHG